MNADRHHDPLRPEWDDLPRDVQSRIQTLVCFSIAVGGAIGFLAAFLIFQPL